MRTWRARSTIDPLAPFHPAVARVVRGGVRRADAPADARLAGDRARRVDADPRADRQRQDADGVSLVPRPADVRAGAARKPRAAASSTSRRSRRSRSTSSATCARRWPASRRSPTARGDAYHAPAIAIRTGDTPQAERARFQREPADILITTPESLYLLLTSNAREALRSVDTVIIDEIHALVPTKRGAHLALSLERLEAHLRRAAAADRPVGDAAAARRGRAVSRRRRTDRRARRPRAAKAAERDLGSRIRRPMRRVEFTTNSPTTTAVRYRPVTIVDAGAARSAASSRIEVPVEDMARDWATPTSIPSGPASQAAGARRRSGRRSIRGCSSSSARTARR